MGRCTAASPGTSEVWWIGASGNRVGRISEHQLGVTAQSAFPLGIVPHAVQHQSHLGRIVQPVLVRSRGGNSNGGSDGGIRGVVRLMGRHYPTVCVCQNGRGYSNTPRLGLVKGPVWYRSFRRW